MSKTGEVVPTNPLVVGGKGHPSVGEAMESRATAFEGKWTRTGNASTGKLRFIGLVRRARKTERP